MMYNKRKSRFINNSLIFCIGMCLAFFVFSFVNSTSSTTANIGDAFTIPTKTLYDASVSLHDDTTLSLDPLQSIPSGSGKSLRISLLYNQALKQSIIASLSSSYAFSFVDDDESLVIIIDLNTQTIEPGHTLLSLPLHVIDHKDIPIIDSMVLFDTDEMHTLSIKNSLDHDIHS